MPFVARVEGLRFDPATIVEAYESVRGLVAPGEAARGEDRLRGISLTHRAGAREPLYDGNESQFNAQGQKVYHEADFAEFHDAFKGTYFWHIYQSLPFRVGRARLLVLPPLTIYGMHCDGTRRAHIAVSTNPGCRLVSQTGVTFHVPVDGQLYVADTQRAHTAYNAGSTERVHLVFAMADTEDSW